MADGKSRPPGGLMTEYEKLYLYITGSTFTQEKRNTTSKLMYRPVSEMSNVEWAEASMKSRNPGVLKCKI